MISTKKRRAVRALQTQGVVRPILRVLRPETHFGGVEHPFFVLRPFFGCVETHFGGVAVIEIRQRKGQQFQGNEEYDYAVDPKTGWMFYRHLRQDRGPTCKKLRHRRQTGIKPIGRRAIGILSVLQALTTRFFSQS